MSNSLPLDGVLVVAIEQAVAIPYCTARLADAGARVIKVERAEGDFARGYDRIAHGESAFFAWLNRGKESLVADIKNPDDVALVQAIIDKADVFVQNLAPGAAARAGLGSKDMRARNPRLITCDLSGYGEEGPYRDMKAYDLLVQAESGIAAVSGSAEEPGRVGVSMCDLTAGTNAHGAILQALYGREKTGRGDGIAVSLFDGMAEWMTVPVLQLELTGAAPARIGFNHPLIAPYGAYATQDGQVVIAVQNEREWVSFCTTVLENPGLATRDGFKDHTARVANRPALNAEIDAVFSRLDRSTVEARLLKAAVAYGGLNTVEDLSRHVALRRADIATVQGRPLKIVAPAVRFAASEPKLGAVPEIGAHSTAIRAEFGD